MMTHDNPVKDEEKSKKGGGKFPKKLFGVLIVLIALIANGMRGMFSIDPSNYVTVIFPPPPSSVPATQSFPFQVNGFRASVNEKLILVQGNITLLFWDGGQERVCKLISALTEMRDNETKIMEAILGYNSSLDLENVQKLFVTSTTSSATTTTSSSRKRILLNITHNSCNMWIILGQGNWLTGLFQTRMAAALLGVDMIFDCHDRETLRMTHLLPWFTGYFPAPQNLTEYFDTLPSLYDACHTGYVHLRLDRMAHVIQRDVRDMARRVLNGNTNNQNNIAPLMANGVELDDVVIHFRCGDVMGGANRNDFGIIAFSEYRKWIRPRPSLKVGILTQPFDRSKTRGHDRGRVDQCKRATYLLVDYLKGFLGNDTRVSIHNGVNETLPLAYARLVMANQSFASLSSFGIFPVMSTFGQGYIQQGNRGVNPFAIHLPNHLPNLQIMHAPVLGTWTISRMFRDQGEDSVWNWLVNTTSTT